jgi:hypothetical protein
MACDTGDAPRQCKDIPDLPILKFLEAHQGQFCNWVFDDELDVRNAMPPRTPDKLALAKMQRLIQRKLVDGCCCGCRGDFEITSEGEKMLEKFRATSTR